MMPARAQRAARSARPRPADQEQRGAREPRTRPGVDDVDTYKISLSGFETRQPIRQAIRKAVALVSVLDPDASVVIEAHTPPSYKPGAQRRVVVVLLTGDRVTGRRSHPSWWVSEAETLARRQGVDVDRVPREIWHYADHTKGRVAIIWWVKR